MVVLTVEDFPMVFTTSPTSDYEFTLEHRPAYASLVVNPAVACVWGSRRSPLPAPFAELVCEPAASGSYP
jgi:hypothetical protein